MQCHEQKIGTSKVGGRQLKKGTKVVMFVIAGSICIGCGIGLGMLFQENHQLKIALRQDVEGENNDEKQIVNTDEGDMEVKEVIDLNAVCKKLATELETKYQQEKAERDVAHTAWVEEYNKETKAQYLSDAYSYLLSESDVMKIEYYDVSSWDEELLALARNEIYARHSYNFQKESYRQIFGTKSWYTPLYGLDQIVLSDVEQYNIMYLEWREKVYKRSKVLQDSERGFSDVYCFNEGQSFKMDLNNDGIEEEIVMEFKLGEEWDRSTCRVKVNGKVQVELERNWDEYIWVVDIDETDDYKELVIHDRGPSSDPVDYYYYYNGKKLIEMGTVVGHINDEMNQVRNYIEGGTLHATVRNDILGTAWYNWDYKLNNEHMLEEIPCDFFKVNIPIIATEDIKIYDSNHLSSKSTHYKAGTAFTAIGTDLNKWIEVELEGGEKGWINEAEYPSYQLGGLFFFD